jgi:hypothetical protein
VPFRGRTFNLLEIGIGTVAPRQGGDSLRMRREFLRGRRSEGSTHSTSRYTPNKDQDPSGQPEMIRHSAVGRRADRQDRHHYNLADSRRMLGIG